MAIQKRNEIEFSKTKTIVNAIIEASGNILSGGQSGFDGTNKSIASLRDLMLPHYKAANDKQAEKVKQTLKKEVDKGELKVMVMGKGKANGKPSRR